MAEPQIPAPVMTAEALDAFLAEAWPDGAGRVHEVVEVTERGISLRLPVRLEHGRPGGTVSGPAMMTLADAAAWVATLSRIGPVALAVTSSLTIHFLRKPPLDSDLIGEATLLRLGWRLSVTDVRVVSEVSGALVAQSTVTYSIPAAPAAPPA